MEWPVAGAPGRIGLPGFSPAVERDVAFVVPPPLSDQACRSSGTLGAPRHRGGSRPSDPAGVSLGVVTRNECVNAVAPPHRDLVARAGERTPNVPSASPQESGL